MRIHSIQFKLIPTILPLATAWPDRILVPACVSEDWGYSAYKIAYLSPALGSCRPPCAGGRDGDFQTEQNAMRNAKRKKVGMWRVGELSFRRSHAARATRAIWGGVDFSQPERFEYAFLENSRRGVI